MPGDLIMVDPAVHQELLLMWKPVRLQGVGAASSIINANTHPAGKLDPWRRQVNCLFGLALNGTPIAASNPYDPSGKYTCPTAMLQLQPQHNPDRLPLEGHCRLGHHAQRQPGRAVAGANPDGRV